MHPSGLTDSRVHSRHGLAAILTAMTIRRTPHRVAALHRLFGLSHTDAVERIRRQSRDQSHDKDSSSHIRNRLARLSRMVVTTEGGLCPPKKKDCKHHHCRAVGVFRPQPVTGILQFRHPCPAAVPTKMPGGSPVDGNQPMVRFSLAEGRATPLLPNPSDCCRIGF